ncbi:MAG: FHA domain-containing protein [Nitrososphaeria archaeon]
MEPTYKLRTLRKALILITIICFLNSLLVGIVNASSFSIVVDDTEYSFNEKDLYFYNGLSRVNRSKNNILLSLSAYLENGETAYSQIPVRLDGKTYTIYYFTKDGLKSQDGEVFSHTINTSIFVDGKGITFVIVLDEKGIQILDSNLLERILKASGNAWFMKNLSFFEIPEETRKQIKEITGFSGWSLIFAQQKAESLLKTKKDLYLEGLRIFLASSHESKEEQECYDFIANLLANNVAAVSLAVHISEIFKATNPEISQRFLSVKNSIDFLKAISGLNDSQLKMLKLEAHLSKVFEDFLKILSNSYLYKKKVRDIARNLTKVLDLEKLNKYYVPLGILSFRILVRTVNSPEVIKQNLETLKIIKRSIENYNLNVDNDFRSALNEAIKEAEEELKRIYNVIKEEVGNFIITILRETSTEKAAKEIAKVAFKKLGTNSILAHGIASSLSNITLGFTIASLIFNLDDIYNNYQLCDVFDYFRQISLDIFNLLKQKTNQNAKYIDGNIIEELSSSYVFGTHSISLFYEHFGNVFRNFRIIKNIYEKKFKEVIETADFEKNFYREVVDCFLNNKAVILAVNLIFSRRKGVFPKQEGTNSETCIIIDTSGSMERSWHGGIKIESAKSAVMTLLNLIENENKVSGSNSISIIAFNDQASLLQEMTSDFSSAKEIVANLYALGSTNLGDALVSSVQALTGSKIPNKFIILLSDGMSNVGIGNEQIISEVVPEIKKIGAKIFSIGFGEKGDLDENLLKEISERTGGQYFYADDAWQLESLYIKTRHASLGKILDEITGTISEGETKDVKVINIGENLKEVLFTLDWPGSQLSLILKDPSGNIVDESYPGVNIIEGKPLLLVMRNPLPGDYKLSVYGEYVPSGSTQFSVTVSSREGKQTDFTKILTILLFLLLIGSIFISVFLVRIRSTNEGDSICVLEEAQSGRIYRLNKKTTYIGRADSNDLKVEDELVSRRHCRIDKVGSSFSIMDMKSKNGTYVNDRKISGSVILNSGDKIRIGKTTLVFSAKKEIRENAYKICLIKVGEEKVVDKFCFSESLISIGRAYDNSLKLNDSLVSKRHCMIRKIGNRYYLTDMNSSNGTYLNGKKLLGTAEIKDGDLVKIGGNVFRIVIIK